MYTDLPIFSQLRRQMSFLAQRQSLLASNVANADTPGFKRRDLKPLDFSDMVQSNIAISHGLHTEHERHIQLSSASYSNNGEITARDGFEVTPEGNGVVLEEEMIKLSENQHQYQLATSVYTRSIKLLKTALSRGV